jgi:hypothetical protein
MHQRRFTRWRLTDGFRIPYRGGRALPRTLQFGAFYLNCDKTNRIEVKQRRGRPCLIYLNPTVRSHRIWGRAMSPRFPTTGVGACTASRVRPPLSRSIRALGCRDGDPLRADVPASGHISKLLLFSAKPRAICFKALASSSEARPGIGFAVSPGPFASGGWPKPLL